MTSLHFVEMTDISDWKLYGRKERTEQYFIHGNKDICSSYHNITFKPKAEISLNYAYELNPVTTENKSTLLRLTS